MTPGEALKILEETHVPLCRIIESISDMEYDSFMTPKMIALKNILGRFIEDTTDIMEDVGDAAFDPETEPALSTSEILKEQVLWANKTYYGITATK